MQFFCDLSKRLRSRTDGHSDLLSDALAYIHRHYNENFSLSDIAAVCNISPSYLRHSFKRKFGRSVMQYRGAIRISQTKTILKSGEFRIKEISDLLGYCDIYHFSRKFKQATGVAPGQYPQRQKSIIEYAAQGHRLRKHFLRRGDLLFCSKSHFVQIKSPIIH